MRALVLFLFCSLAQAQFVSPTPGTRPTALAPDLVMPASKMFIDWSTAPQYRHYGRSTQSAAVTSSTINISSSTYNNGGFRVVCGFSHVAPDDPIVWPGRSGKSHPHVFFGNVSTRAASDLANMATSGNSTCFGGTLNRSGYWMPAVIYHCPLGLGGCNTARDGELILPDHAGNFYYKCQSVPTCDSVTWYAPGHNMIAGSATNTLPWWNYEMGSTNIQCFNPEPVAGVWDHIPSPAELDAIKPGGCTLLNFFISFPRCNNGDTSAPDFKSHMAYTVGETGCPASHPYLKPDISFNIKIAVTSPYTDLPFYRLVSDRPETYGTTQAGSTTTQVKLAASESAVDDFYLSGTLMIGSALRYITAYNGTTKVATVASAFSSAPAAGTSYGIRNAAGRTLHADWVNGWDEGDFMGLGLGSITDIIIRNCYRKGHVPTQEGDCHDHHLGTPSDVDQATNSWQLQ